MIVNPGNVRESRIFVGRAAVGLVCNQVPACLRYYKEGAVLHTAVDNTIHTYRVPNLTLQYVSEQLPFNVNCLAYEKHMLYAGCDQLVVMVNMGKIVEHIFKGHQANVKFLIPFGAHLISIDEQSRLIIWNVTDREVFSEMNFDPRTFQVSAACHPITYVNKLLLASEQGSMRLVNVKTGKVVYEFAGWQCPVMAIKQSTVVDVVAIALSDGRVQVHNLRYDKTLMVFKHGDGPVRAVSFRTDAVPMLITGNDSGELAVWDLDKKQLTIVTDAAHEGRVISLNSLRQEPCVISTGEDNSIKLWLFDTNVGTLRLYRFVEGHSKAPLRVQFHGLEGRSVVSAGGDGKVKVFDILSEVKNANLGTAARLKRSLAKKRKIDFDQCRLPPVVFFDISAARESSWDNMICCHQNSAVVTKWSTKKCRAGSGRLVHRRFKTNPSFVDSRATCCAITSCGNFALIGYSSGHVDLFNVQSDNYRGSLCDAQLADDKAHAAIVQGVCADSLNQLVATGCSQGRLKLWHFNSKSLMYSRRFECGFKRMTLHRENNLLAAAMDNLSIVVFDVRWRRVVRTLPACHKAAVTDLTISPNGHWLLSSSQDCTVKVWDLLNAVLVDVLAFSQPCKSLTMNSTGEYLATCHAERLGVYLWVNKALHRPQITLKPLAVDYEPSSIMDMPTAQAEEQEHGDSSPYQRVEDDVAQEEVYESPAQIDNLCCTSKLPASRWANLPELDAIRRRNKPKEPLKKIQMVPFLLQQPQAKEKPGQRVAAKALRVDRGDSAFGIRLANCQNEMDHWAAFELLTTYNRAAVYNEIATLTMVNDQRSIVHFLRMLHTIFRDGRHFELANAYLAVFLNTGAEALLERKSSDRQELARCLRNVLDAQEWRWRRLDKLFAESTAMVAFVSSSLV